MFWRGNLFQLCCDVWESFWIHVLEGLKKLVVSVNLQWKIKIVIDVLSANILEQSYPTKSYLSLFLFYFSHHEVTTWFQYIQWQNIWSFYVPIQQKIAIALTFQKKRKRRPPRIDHECFAPVSLGWGRSHDAYKTTRKPYTHVAFREKPFFGIIENPKVYESSYTKTHPAKGGRLRLWIWHRSLQNKIDEEQWKEWRNLTPFYFVALFPSNRQCWNSIQEIFWTHRTTELPSLKLTAACPWKSSFQPFPFRDFAIFCLCSVAFWCNFKDITTPPVFRVSLLHLALNSGLATRRHHLGAADGLWKVSFFSCQTKGRYLWL